MYKLPKNKTLKRNGTYLIEVKDIAGNKSSYEITIDKPFNYVALIIGVGGVTILAGVVIIIIKGIKKKKIAKHDG